MQTNDIAARFLAYFEQQGHLRHAPASLVPENDASVLFTTAGMQQFKGYYLKPGTAPSKRIVNIQPVVRTVDIDEVGDDTHATWFEMLGYFSFGYQGQTEPNGPYFKRQAIEYAWEFFTNQLGIARDRLEVHYFAGDELTPADEESHQLVKDITGLPDERIIGLPREDNFWGPTGTEGPCGPDIEWFVNGVEIGNNVFNEYYFKDGQYTKLEQQGVDTGFGLERIAIALEGVDNLYGTDLIAPLIETTRSLAKQPHERSLRIIVDHLKTSTFLIADGVVPSNKEQGYILRRLLRRSIREAARIELAEVNLKQVVAAVIEQYAVRYPKLTEQAPQIQAEIAKEAAKFNATLKRGLSVLDKEMTTHQDLGQLAFFLFESYGFPLEQTLDELREHAIHFDQSAIEKVFAAQLSAHQNISKSGLAQKFKGGLAGHSDQEVRYHTATHLLNAALRQVLGGHVWQKGSNITPDRLRFDFSHGEQLTADQKAQVESLVNKWITADLPVSHHQLDRQTAKQRGAIGVFEEKYGDEVSVYQIGPTENVVSQELCGGPHVKRTGMIGHFHLQKEEASSAGVRRVKAIVDPSSTPLELA